MAPLIFVFPLIFVKKYDNIVNELSHILARNNMI